MYWRLKCHSCHFLNYLSQSGFLVTHTKCFHLKPNPNKFTFQVLYLISILFFDEKWRQYFHIRINPEKSSASYFCPFLGACKCKLNLKKNMTHTSGTNDELLTVYVLLSHWPGGEFVISINIVSYAIWCSYRQHFSDYAVSSFWTYYSWNSLSRNCLTEK